MSIWTDEPVQLEVRVTDFDSNKPMSNTDLDRVTVRVVGTSGEVLPPADMAYNVATKTWRYAWVTPGQGGQYTVEAQSYAVGETASTPIFQKLKVTDRPV
jgi:hypothetical protein